MHVQVRSLLPAAAVESLEGVTLVALAGYVVVETALGAATAVATAAALAATTVVLGILALWVGIALLQGRRWSRPAAVMTQVCALPVAWSLLSYGWIALGIPLAVAVVVALVSLLHPVSTRALARHGSDTG